MKVSTRILSAVIALVLAFGINPIPAFAIQESTVDNLASLDLIDDAMPRENLKEEVFSEEQEQPDASVALDAIEESGGIAVVNDKESSMLSYVFIEHPKLCADEAQRIVVGISEEASAVDEASLMLVASDSNDQIEIPLTRSVAGALLFEIPPGSLATGSYMLSTLEIDNALLISIDEKGKDYTFIVARKTESVFPPAGQKSVEGVETDALAMDADGEIVSADGLSGALNEVSKGLSDDVMVLGAGSRSATKIPSATSPLVVVLDPGHGGYDGGAGGYGVQENYINLRIAQYCRDELEKYLFVDVYMTREDDTYVSLSDRVDFAVNHGADLVLSLHNNSSTSSSPHGSEVIIPNDSSWYYDETHVVGEEFAEKVLGQLTSLGLSVSQGGIYWRDCTNDERYGDGSLSDYYTLIAGPRESGILGVIIEHAFVSNPGDAAFLASEENLRALGVADAQAVVEQYGLRLKTPMYGFSDVYEETPHHQEIGWLSASGVSTGYLDGSFRPLDSVTRQDMAAFLYRLAGSPSYTPTESEMDRFSDVDEGTPHYKEILWMASTKITTGFQDGSFKPKANVTREDMAAFMRRAYDYLTNDASSAWEATASVKEHFSDVFSTTPHAEDIWWLASMGISLGFPDGSYGIGSSVARADIAAFMFRLSVCAEREAARAIPIMGETQTNIDQLVDYFKSSGSSYPSDVYKGKGAETIYDFASIVIEESEGEGVRAEVVFCQAMKETGWFKFDGDVEAWQCNFAGLGATGNGAGGAKFEDVRTGVRAQVQHLKAYASTEPLVNKCVDPRFDLVVRGSAPYLTSLNGKWAVPGTRYGHDIASMIERLYKF